MKGLRSGQSVTPIRKARATAAGFRAIGRRTGGRVKLCFVQPAAHRLTPPPVVWLKTKEEKHHHPRPINPEPVRPKSANAEMWEVLKQRGC